MYGELIRSRDDVVAPLYCSLMSEDSFAPEVAERVALARRHLGPVARGRLAMTYLDTPYVLTVEQRAFALGNDVHLMGALIDDYERSSGSMAAGAMSARYDNDDERARWFADESRTLASRPQLVRDTRRFADATGLPLCGAELADELRVVQRWKWASIDGRFRCRARMDCSGGFDQCAVHGAAFVYQRRRRIAAIANLTRKFWAVCPK